jgi:hypothetical protein
VCVVVSRGDIARCWIARLLLATHATFLGTTRMTFLILSVSSDISALSRIVACHPLSVSLKSDPAGTNEQKVDFATKTKFTAALLVVVSHPPQLPRSPAAVPGSLLQALVGIPLCSVVRTCGRNSQRVARGSGERDCCSTTLPGGSWYAAPIRSGNTAYQARSEGTAIAVSSHYPFRSSERSHPSRVRSS